MQQIENTLYVMTQGAYVHLENDTVRIDVSRAHFWDITAVSALDKVVLKFRREGAQVEVMGLNEASKTMVDRFGLHDKDGAELPLGH